MYPHVTQFETRMAEWQREMQLREMRPRPRSRLLARLPLVSRAIAPATPHTGRVESA